MVILFKSSQPTKIESKNSVLLFKDYFNFIETDTYPNTPMEKDFLKIK